MEYIYTFPLVQVQERFVQVQVQVLTGRIALGVYSYERGPFCSIVHGTFLGDTLRHCQAPAMATAEDLSSRYTVQYLTSVTSFFQLSSEIFTFMFNLDYSHCHHVKVSLQSSP
jgi:hypothetical protein